MGLLDQVLGGVLGNVLGGGGSSQGHGRAQGQGRGGSQGGLGEILGGAASSPLVRALVMLLLSKAASGGLGDIFGRGQPAGRTPSDPVEERDDRPARENPFGREAGGAGTDADNPYDDLAGAFDKPGAVGSAGLAPSGGSAGGGLGGLVDSFQRGGLGDVMGSWIGGGENRAIAPNQLGQALGPDTVDQLAQETGMDRDALLSQLAQVLPGVVDKLTPHGRAPTPDEVRHW